MVKKRWKAWVLGICAVMGAGAARAESVCAFWQTEKVWAVANVKDVTVYEEMDSNGQAVGILPQGGLCYVLKDEEGFWHYVESGNVRGFVRAGELLLGETAREYVEERGEENLPSASSLVDAGDNAAWNHTNTSVVSGVSLEAFRQNIVEYALQFVGNPYVWGGSSLTEGADCSGFTQSVYAAFHYAIPRTSQAQAICGRLVPLDEALPADLILYVRNGEVYHVALYAGDGQTVQAADEERGICVSGIGGDAAWAVRLIE